MKTHKKPMVKFCWDCGRKLWGKHHEVMRIDGEDRTLHHFCAKVLKKKEGWLK